MLMLGERVQAGQALAVGLANAVTSPADLDDAVSDLAGRLKERAPWGLAMTKEMLNRATSMDYSSAIEMEAWTQTLMMTGKDFREFHAAFTEKRSPSFQGR
jgi:enoyl-CoA hydratase/carnithine racemase